MKITKNFKWVGILLLGACATGTHNGDKRIPADDNGGHHHRGGGLDNNFTYDSYDDLSDALDLFKDVNDDMAQAGDFEKARDLVSAEGKVKEAHRGLRQLGAILDQYPNDNDIKLYAINKWAYAEQMMINKKDHPSYAYRATQTKNRLSIMVSYILKSDSYKAEQRRRANRGNGPEKERPMPPAGKIVSMYCPSDDNKPRTCYLPAAGRIIKARKTYGELSHADCVEHQSFDYLPDLDGVNVWAGCRGTFEFLVMPDRYQELNKAVHPGHCASDNFQPANCHIAARVLAIWDFKTISHAECTEGKTFFRMPNNDGIRVEKGCELTYQYQTYDDNYDESRDPGRHDDDGNDHR